LLRRFTTELQALTRRLEAALVLVVGDDQVREVRHFEPGRGDLDGLAVAGGGGTDFTPLLEEASKHGPDLIVVLTDLDGPARYRPRCPVLWAVTEAHAAANVPFGRLLVLR
jgi:predicted metal-dependent peptidase